MQAYEDVLERYKGEAGARPAPAAARGPRLGPPRPRGAAGCRWGGGRGARPPARGRAGSRGRHSGPASGEWSGTPREPGSQAAAARRSPITRHTVCFIIWPGPEEERRGAGSGERLLWDSAAAEELGSRERGSRSVSRGELSQRWLSGGGWGVARPLLSPCLSEESRGSLGCRAPRGSRGVGGGWVAWPVSVQISVARPPHPHAAPLDVWACLVEAGV